MLTHLNRKPLKRSPLKKKSQRQRLKDMIGALHFKKKSKSERSKLIKQCDDIFRVIIRKRDKVCQLNFSSFDLQVAHFITRSNIHLRWDLDNACLLNKGTHYYWAHVNHQQFRQFWIDRIGLEKVEKMELQNRTKSYPLYTCDLKLIKRCLLDILNK